MLRAGGRKEKKNDTIKGEAGLLRVLAAVGRGKKKSLSALTPKILSHLLYWFLLDPSCHLVIESLTLQELCDLSTSPISQRGHFWFSDKLISFRCWVCERVSLMDILHMFSHLTGTHNGTIEALWWCWTADSWPAALPAISASPKCQEAVSLPYPEDHSKLDIRVAGQGRLCLCSGHSSSQGVGLIHSRNS